MQVFIDTSYLIAILEPTDDRHEKAKAVSMSLGDSQQVTSEMVLTELLNAFCTRGKFFRQMALNVVDDLRSDSNVENCLNRLVNIIDSDRIRNIVLQIVLRWWL